MCGNCQGQGVTIPAGQHAPAATAAGGTAGGRAQQPEAATPAARHDPEDLWLQVDRIEAKQKAYRQELGAAEAVLAGGDGGGAHAAARQLADVLEGQLAKLERWRQARLRALGGGGPDGAEVAGV
jgi:hypothetical protein